MIKEIMLASSIMATSLNTYPFYDVSSFGNRIGFSVDHEALISDIGEYFVLYNLSNGSYDICTLVTTSDGTYTIHEYDIFETQVGYTNPLISDYYIYTLNNTLGFTDGIPLFTDYSYLSMGCYLFIDGINLTDNIDNEDANIDYELVVKDSVNEVFMSISSRNYILLYDNSPSYIYLEFDDVLSGSFSINDNSEDYYLLIKPNAMYSEGGVITFDFCFDFENYEYYYQLMNGYGEGFNNLWDNFLYHNLHSIINDNQNLERDNEILNGIINDLREENDYLNSKHVLSNVFEIVRGAFDGIVNFLEIELMPNLTIGTIVFIPVVIGVIFFILKALVL